MAIDEDIEIINNVIEFVGFLNLITKKKKNATASTPKLNDVSILEFIGQNTLSWRKYESINETQREKCILAAIQQLQLQES